MRWAEFGGCVKDQHEILGPCGRSRSYFTAAGNRIDHAGVKHDRCGRRNIETLVKKVFRQVLLSRTGRTVRYDYNLPFGESAILGKEIGTFPSLHDDCAG